MIRWLRPFSVLTLSLLITTNAHAQPPEYLSELPAPARVVQDMKVASQRESAVRAAVALNQFAGIVQVLSGVQQRRQPSPEEAQRIALYRQQSAAVFKVEEDKAGPCATGDDNCQEYLLNRCAASFEFSPAFHREILDRYFSPQWQAQYARRFAAASGTVWQQAIALPAGTKVTLSPREAQNCADASASSRFSGLLNSVTRGDGGGGAVGGGGLGSQVSSVLSTLLSLVTNLIFIAVVIAGIGLMLFYRYRYSRYYLLRQNNREAIEAFGTGSQSAREQAIIDAFDSPDFTFRYAGVSYGGSLGGRLAPNLSIGGLIGSVVALPFVALIKFVTWLPALIVIYIVDQFVGTRAAIVVGVAYVLWRTVGRFKYGADRVRFVLLRNIRSFRRGHLEAMRFGYLAFNRGLIDEEKFHWYRFTAIYADGHTDPAEWEFGGLTNKWFSGFKSKQGDIDKAREAVKSYATDNVGSDIEAQALATVQRLAHEHPEDPLWQDMRRRFVEGSYWLTQGELKRTVFAPSDSPYVITLGTLDGTNNELVFSGEGSIMTIAPPGAGKTQCNVFPNLLRWPGPAVVLDVKGEIYDGTSAWRAANVGPVIKFSPLDPHRSARFNPLSGVRSESLYLWEDARFLADMMIVPKAKEPFWEDKAKEILTLIIADVAFWNPPDDRAMSKVLAIINRNGWNEFIDRSKKNPELQTIRDEGANLASMDPRTLDGALQTAKASLAAWVGERINMVTRQSDWSPLDLRNGTNPTLYVCVKPNEIEAYLSLLRVVIAQHIRALTSELPPRGAAPILFVLDELPRLRQMPPVEEALEVGRQYGIKLWMFAQSIGQMKNAYPNGEGMMGSCAVRTFMNPSLQDGTAKMIAEQIGMRSGEEHGGKEGDLKEAALVVEPTQLAGVEFKELQIVMGVGSKPAKVRKKYAHADQMIRSRMGTYQQEVRGEAAAT
ncbi:MAG TPA: type IV secretory system conjugative DNA transfer family protein [Vicinamibacterales bacterium]|jgi:type IV secretory system conjugative DNA transfer VirD4/TraG family protein|nr:type IV secretory system conjugative DNA transfer family protein [Vicinamibacterales bacterium]